MRSLIIGAGEVGNALKEIFTEAGFEVETKDIEEKEIKPGFDVMHVCLNFVALGKERWLDIVKGYVQQYEPKLIDVLSTVEPGTTRLLGSRAVHSTTRGLHPHLAEGIRTIAKHIGGPRSQEAARYYSKAGVKCVTHRKAATTEVAHIAHLLDYGLQIASADMRNALCRKANVDYMESVVRYTDTHNAGFAAMDMPSKVRMSLTPPNGKIGGHCVVQAAQLANRFGFYHPLCNYLAGFNQEKIKVFSLPDDEPEARVIPEIKELFDKQLAEGHAIVARHIIDKATGEDGGE